jgi:hypothetical protein
MRARWVALAGAAVALVGCTNDDSGKIRQTGGVYRITDIDVTPSKYGDLIVVQMVNVDTGEKVEMAGTGNDGESILERLLPLLGCVMDPANRETIRAVACG